MHVRGFALPYCYTDGVLTSPTRHSSVGGVVRQQAVSCADLREPNSVPFVEVQNRRRTVHNERFRKYHECHFRKSAVSPWWRTSAPASQSGTPPSTQAKPQPGATAPDALRPPAPPGPQHAQVDVEQVLDGLLEKKGQKLDWRHSIVDLMKLIDLDSSLNARKELAQELHYSGETNDSAAMNIWLHKQVMTKLSENGGTVSANLKH
jgi:hypothetical protein